MIFLVVLKTVVLKFFPTVTVHQNISGMMAVHQIVSGMIPYNRGLVSGCDQPAKGSAHTFVSTQLWFGINMLKKGQKRKLHDLTELSKTLALWQKEKRNWRPYSAIGKEELKNIMPEVMMH